MAGAVFVRPATARGNVRCLQLMVRAVLQKNLSDTHPEELTDDMVETFFSQRLRLAGKDQAKLGSQEITANSIYRQARSVFAKRALRLYGDLKLPELESFTRVPLLRENKSTAFVPFPTQAWQDLTDSVDEVKNTRRPLWRAFMLMSRLGMRNSEVRAARGDWLETDENGQGIMVIKTRADFRPKSRNSARRIPIAADLWADLVSFFQQPVKLVMNGDKIVYRELCRLVRRFIPDRTKAAYELRKQAGSVVATRDGIFAAARFLGDTVATTEAYYAALLKPLLAI